MIKAQSSNVKFVFLFFSCDAVVNDKKKKKKKIVLILPKGSYVWKVFFKILLWLNSIFIRTWLDEDF